MSWQGLFWVFIGGGLGSVVRYSIGKISFLNSHSIPYHTIATNFLASLLIGFLIYYSMHKWESASWLKMALVIGFCGGFSTFSTFSYENMRLMQQAQWLPALANILLSVVSCIIAVFFGLKLAEWLLKPQL